MHKFPSIFSRKYFEVVTDDIKTDLQFVWSVLKEAFRHFGKNFGIIIVYSVISAVILSILALLSTFINVYQEVTISVVLCLLIMFVQAYTTLSLYKFIFTLIDSEYYEFEISQIFPQIKMIFSYLKLSISYVILVGTFDFFIVGLLLKDYSFVQDLVKNISLAIMAYLALRCMFFISFIVDDSSGSIESLKQSFRLTRSNIFKNILLLIFFFIIIYIPLKGAISFNWKFLVFTLLLLYPYVNIALAVAYRKMIHDSQGVDDITSETV